MIYNSFFDELEKISAVLSLQHREKLPSKSFAVPQRTAKRIGVAGSIQGSSKGKYPIHDAAHARAALRMVAMHGTPEEKEIVRAKVRARYPEIGQKTAGIRSGLKTLLTGRVPLFHGTTAERAAQIAEKGLLPQGAHGVTQMFPELAAREKNLVFTSLGKGAANTYAWQQAGADRLQGMQGLLDRVNSSVQGTGVLPGKVRHFADKTRSMLGSKGNNMARRQVETLLGALPGSGKKVVRADIPRSFLKEHATLGQELPWMIEHNILPPVDPLVRNIQVGSNFSSHVPVQGGVPAKYIRGSSAYQPVTMGEIKQHVKDAISDPVGVGKDVIRSTLGFAHRPSTLLKNTSMPAGVALPTNW